MRRTRLDEDFGCLDNSRLRFAMKSKTRQRALLEYVEIIVPQKSFPDAVGTTHKAQMKLMHMWRKRRGGGDVLTL